MKAKDIKITSTIGLCELCINCKSCSNIEENFMPSKNCDGPYYKEY